MQGHHVARQPVIPDQDLVLIELPMMKLTCPTQITEAAQRTGPSSAFPWDNRHPPHVSVSCLHSHCYCSCRLFTLIRDFLDTDMPSCGRCNNVLVRYLKFLLMNNNAEITAIWSGM